MTPHDSTRCATLCEDRGCSIACEHYRPTPSEPVGAVDALERLKVIEARAFTPSGDIMVPRLDLRALIEQVATLTASNRNLTTMLEEEAYHRMNAEINALPNANEVRIEVARATPAEGEAVAWKHTLPAKALFDDERDYQLCHTLAEAQEEQSIHGGTIIPLYTTPPRSAQAIARALLGEGWLADSLDTPEKLRDYFVELGRQSAPPRSPATVTEAMVQTAARVLHPVEDQSLTRQLARRDLIRKALTAAIGGRDA